MLGTILAFLGVSERARAELTSEAMRAQTPLVEQAREATVNAAFALRRALPIVSLVPALTLAEPINPDTPPKHVSALDASMAEDIVAPSGPLFCHGPSCSMTIAVLSNRHLSAGQQQVASIRFISSMGSSASALLAYFCTPKVGHVTWRFGLVSAVGGPAFGLRVRW